MTHSEHPHHNSVFFSPDTEAGVQLQMRNNPSNSLDVCQPSVMPGGPEPKGVKKTWERGEKKRFSRESLVGSSI